MGNRREPRKASLEVNTHSGVTDSKGEQMQSVMKLERPLWKAVYSFTVLFSFSFFECLCGHLNVYPSHTPVAIGGENNIEVAFSLLSTECFDTAF